MNLNIPDKVYKLTILLGLILIGYSEYKSDIYNVSDSIQHKKHSVLQDSLYVNILKSQKEFENVKDEANFLSKKYYVENPIIEKDSTTTFYRIIGGSKNELYVNDHIKNLWNSYKNSEFKIKLLKEELKKQSIFMEYEEKVSALHQKKTEMFHNFGGLLFILGFIIWAIDEQSDRKKSSNQNEKIHTNCQSCGKKFSAILEYGTNENKSQNYAFCKQCYQDGCFTNPNLTKVEFMTESKEKLKNKNWLRRNLILNKLYFLERWNENQY